MLLKRPFLHRAVIFVTVLSGIVSACNHRETITAIAYVDPLVGTAASTTESAEKHSEAGSELKGQTFPAVGVPHGMTQWTPQTRASERKCIAPYYYRDSLFQGFRGSHWLSGSCTQDYGSVTIMPMTGALKVKAEERASLFHHANEKASPDYYSVYLDKYKITAEVSALSRASIMRFSSEDSDAIQFIVEPNSDEGEGYIEIDPAKKEIVGYNPAHRIYQGWGESAGFSGYFVAVFDTDFEHYGTWNGDSIQDKNIAATGAKSSVGAYVAVRPGIKEVHVKIGTSFTSIEGARKNLEAAITGWDFDAVRNESASTWNKALTKVEVKGSEESKKLFYTALYHAELLPRVFNDADGSYPEFGGSGKIMTATGYDYYDDFSMWDTYRAVHPLLTLLEPQSSGDMVKSLLTKADQGGWLPIFPCWNNYTAAMIGDHAIAMIGDALMKDIASDEMKRAYTIMRKNAFEVNTDTASYKDGKGRRALASYLQYGYIPLEDSVLESFHKREQVSRTLEYAYDDFVLSQVARKLGKNEDYKRLSQRAGNYKNVIDPAIGYARGRYADGKWIESFDSNAIRASYITEGSPFQYTWYVPQDIGGLIAVLGGKENFITKLDTFFDQRYYWHGNEPGHQTVYLYNHAGEPWKTQGRIHQIVEEEYSTGPGGLSGNEDGGQMSAWLAFNMIGIYPTCPGLPYYDLGTPFFEEVSIHTGTNTFTLKATNFKEGNKYIQSATLNGTPFNRTYLLHDEIVKGGTLILEMGSQPNKAWGSDPVYIP
ncbi:GH92 family glycosyl hydrolase [Ohtaekwangia koreensis]|uniref:Alpha-1,2-mannosidase, putative n=1 Tax=Ohtaekwangia koreensis TaxID=688867 RepID=A0A1T5M6W3_9BACT|nr:GH92 family glycosyl hydrolase [Ohtaekwangia koreensis]SKC83966.1 alpha-1,2-mannosidase, putative [Ohtaekwangia koreensis]